MGVSCEDARLAFLDGRMTPEVEQHLAECERCETFELLRHGLADPDEPSGGLALDATAASDAGTLTPAGPDVLPEVARGRYALGAEVGHGGLGRVLRARDVILGRTIAIKELLDDDDAHRRRFVREALITARLQHPAIVPVYEAARWADRAPFYAMKLVVGRPLSKAIDEATTFEARLALVPTVLAVADAIAYAHAERIIHRDLKPGNVMVGAFGETVVIDWGLAKDLSIDDHDAPDAGPYRAATGEETAAGVLLGTPAYMAPEQAAREEVDERADVYALGAILYHVVTGAIPHEGATADEMIARVIAGDVRPVSSREPRVPADLVAIIAKAMARARADRYANARELADDLRRFVSGQLVAVHRYSLGELVRRWARRHRVALVVAAVAAAVLVGYGTWSVRRIVDESARADRARDQAIASARDASTERDRALAQANRAVLAQARATVPTDPGEALRLLATLSPSGPGWASARVIAADALARPRVITTALLRQDTRPPIETSKWTVDAAHGRAFAWSWGILWIIDLDTGSVKVVDAGRPIWPDEMIACDDGARLIGATTATGGAEVVTFALTADAPAQRTMPLDEAWRTLAACDDDLDLWLDRGRLSWWDARRRAARVLADRGVTAALLTADHAHALSIDDRGVATRWDLAAATSTPLGTFAGAIPVAASADGRTSILHARDVDVVARAGEAPIPLPARGAAWVVAPDGAWVAIATPDRVIWLRGPRLERAVELLDQGVASLARSEDGRWLIGRGARTIAWDMTADAWPQALGDREDVAADAAGGDRIVTRDREGSVRVWSLSAPRLLLDDPRSVVASGDGRWIVDETTDGLRRLDTRGAAAPERTTWPVAPPLSPTLLVRGGAVSPSGDVIVTIGDQIWIWRHGGAWDHLGTAPETGALAEPVVGWSATGAPVTWADREIVVWEPGGARRIQPFRIPAVRRLVAVRDDLALAAAVDTLDGSVVLVDLAKTTETALPGSSGASIEDRVAFSEDGRHLVTGSADGTIDGHLIWDVTTARARPVLRGDANRASIVISRDGRRAVLGTPTGAEVVDVATGRRDVLDTGGAVEDLAFDERGARLVTATAHGARLWDLDAHEARDLLASEPRFVQVGPDAVIVADGRGVFRFADDLPTAPCALLARLGAPCPR